MRNRTTAATLIIAGLAILFMVGGCSPQHYNKRAQTKKKMRYYNSIWYDSPKREKPPRIKN